MLRPTAAPHHVKSDSEATSLETASPPRSPRRPVYFVQSPSLHDVEKMSYASSPPGTPHHPAAAYPFPYHCSPIHHSRESSSTSRFSASLRNPRQAAAAAAAVPWKKLSLQPDSDDGEDDPDDREDRLPCHPAKFYTVCFVFSFVVLFTIFSLILWAVSTAFAPKISVKWIVFESLNLQAGLDGTGVPTEMLSLNSTVRIMYRNPATFFGVHVTSTPLDLYYYQFKMASGHMKKFYRRRKSEGAVTVVVESSQVAVYGGLSQLGSSLKDHPEGAVLPLNLTFVMRSRAFVLGRLVKPKFRAKVRCSVTFRGNRLGKRNNLTRSCTFH